VVVGDPKPEKGSFYRSDHFELSKKGVPMVYAKPGFDHREKGLKYGLGKMAEYVADDYHRPSDQYLPSWDMTGAIEDLELFYWVGLDVVNSGKWPGWVEGTEFKAARDKQMAQKK
jgi:Zn-dependent M28 family amino/carboxypeptidase